MSLFDQCGHGYITATCPTCKVSAVAAVPRTTPARVIASDDQYEINRRKLVEGWPDIMASAERQIIQTGERQARQDAAAGVGQFVRKVVTA